MLCVADYLSDPALSSEEKLEYLLAQNNVCQSDDENEDNDDNEEALVCSFCRAKMTDDEKCELLTVEELRRPMRSNTYPGDGEEQDLTASCRSVSVSTDLISQTLTDEEKERLYAEAKSRIFKATEEHRRRTSPSSSFVREGERKSSRSWLYIWARRSNRDAAE